MQGISLPRAITFTASLYSLGVPPELLGLNALDGKDLDVVRETYTNFDEDLKDALSYFNPHSPFVPEELKETLKRMKPDFEADSEHKKITSQIAESIRKNENGDLAEHVLRAASIRKFIG